LCRRVLMFHHFPGEPDVGAESLVRSTDFAYRHDTAPADEQNPVYSRLVSVAQKGFRPLAAGGYLSNALPPVEFAYSEPVVQSTVQIVSAASLENLPSGDSQPFQWTDLHGEGAPGLLAEQGGAWFYKRNWSGLGDGTVDFGPLQRVPVQPNLS